MWKSSVTLEDEEQERCAATADADHSQSSPDMTCSDSSRPTPELLNLEASVMATATSPSPSSNGSKLLSLPWEIVMQIASHLPAQCVMNVLPQVCPVLGRVGEDRLLWQLRAHRLLGPQTSFPVGPQDDFDWSRACLEMEQLIGFWTAAEGGAGRQEQRAVPHEDLAGAVGGLDGEVEAVGEILADVDLKDAAEVREEHSVRGTDADLSTTSSSSSPLEHVILPPSHIADVNCVLLLGGQGALCASGSRDRDVKLWDLRQGRRGALLHTLGGSRTISTHHGWVWCLASSGPLLASGSFDSTVRLWDLGAGGAERGVIRCRAAVLCLSCEGDTVLAGSHDQNLNIYDTRAADPLVKSLRLHGGAVLCLASDEQFILSASKDQTVALFDRRAGKLLQKVQLDSYLLCVSCSGREVWAGDNHGLIHTFSLHNGSLTHLSQFNIHSAMVTGIHSSPGSLYTCSSDRTIKVHHPSAPPKTLCTLQHQAGVNGLSVEAETLAIASADINVEVWRPSC